MDIKYYFSLIFLKKHKRKIIFLSVIGLWFIYFLWGIVIALRTALVDSIPVWETHILAGLIAGLTFSGIMKFRGCSRIDALSFFIEGAVVGSICVLNIYAICTYLAPGYTIEYESEYQYTVPKMGYRRCSGGLSIKDIHTKNWIRFCKEIPELDYEYEQARNTVWVTARVNKFGTYIIDYKIIPKDEREHFLNSEFGGYI